MSRDHRSHPDNTAPSLLEGAEGAKLLAGFFAYNESNPGETTLRDYRTGLERVVHFLMIARHPLRRRRLRRPPGN